MQAPDGRFQTAVSGNGRYAAFVSTDDLADYYQGSDHGNRGQRAVFVRDLQTDRTVQISAGGINFVDLAARVRPPTVTVSPGVIHTGQVTTVSGSGFAPRRIVAVVTPEGGQLATLQSPTLVIRHG